MKLRKSLLLAVVSTAGLSQASISGGEDVMAEVDRERKAAETILAMEIAKEKAAQQAPDAPGREVDCTSGGNNTFEINVCGARDLGLAEAEMRAHLAIARGRFVEGVNSEYNEDSDAEKTAAVAEFDHAQKAWEALRDAHCNSVYYEWKGGTIRGSMNLGCRIQLTRIRTRLLWQEWLQYQDSTPPILPMPPGGFVDEPDQQPG